MVATGVVEKSVDGDRGSATAHGGGIIEDMKHTLRRYCAERVSRWYLPGGRRGIHFEPFLKHSQRKKNNSKGLKNVRDIKKRGWRETLTLKMQGNCYLHRGGGLWGAQE